MGVGSYKVRIPSSFLLHEIKSHHWKGEICDRGQENARLDLKRGLLCLYWGVWLRNKENGAWPVRVHAHFQPGFYCSNSFNFSAYLFYWIIPFLSRAASPTMQYRLCFFPTTSIRPPVGLLVDLDSDFGVKKSSSALVVRSPSPDSTGKICRRSRLGTVDDEDCHFIFQIFWNRKSRWKKGIRGQNEDSLSPDCSRPSQLCSLLSTGWFDLNCHYLNMSSRAFLLEEKVPSLWSVLCSCIDTFFPWLSCKVCTCATSTDKFGCWIVSRVVSSNEHRHFTRIVNFKFQNWSGDAGVARGEMIALAFPPCVRYRT